MAYAVHMAARTHSADPRAERVRTLLRDAAFALAHEGPVDEITVGDLVARAGVSRQVFYQHFKDRDDFLAIFADLSLLPTTQAFGAVDTQARLVGQTVHADAMSLSTADKWIVSRLQKLATDLLDLTRLDAGKFAVERESIDFAVIVELLAAEFQLRAAATRHRIAVRHQARRKSPRIRP